MLRRAIRCHYAVTPAAFRYAAAGDADISDAAFATLFHFFGACHADADAFRFSLSLLFFADTPFTRRCCQRYLMLFRCLMLLRLREDVMLCFYAPCLLIRCFTRQRYGAAML